MRFYYVHPESESAIVTDEEIDLDKADPCLIPVEYKEYLRSCIEWGIKPEAPEFEDLGI